MKLKDKYSQVIIANDKSKVLKASCIVKNVALRKSGLMTGSVPEIGRVQLLQQGIWIPMN